MEFCECDYVNGMYLCDYCKSHPLEALEVIATYYDTFKLKLLQLYRKMEESTDDIEAKTKYREEILFLKSLP